MKGIPMRGSTWWLLLGLLLGAISSSAQELYLRSSTPAGVRVTFATNTTPIVLTTDNPHGLKPDDVVGVYGLCMPTSANGVWRVKAVDSPTTFSIKKMTGEDVAGNGDWDPCYDASLGYHGTPPKFAGKLLPYSLIAHPRIMLDGPTGAATRKVSLGVHNGLVNIAVQSQVATVTTSYDHQLQSGNSIGVWNSGVNNLNGTYVITVISPTRYSFTTNASNGVYSNAGMRISALAHANNPIWNRIVQITNSFTTDNYYRNFRGLSQLNVHAIMALRWFIDPAFTAGRDAALYHLANFERIGGVSFPCDEKQVWCGNGDTDYMSLYLKAFGLTYTIMRDYIQTNWTEAQRVSLRNKVFADRADSCSAPTPLPNVVAKGTARGGGTQSIILSEEASEVDGHYTDVFVEIISGPGAGQRRRITGYTGSTRQATIDTAWAQTPTSASGYRILASIVSYSNGSIVGKLTRWQSDPDPEQRISAGDGLYVGTFGESYNLTVVTSVTSDTTLTATGGNGASQPTIFWKVGAWRDGQCGAMWFIKHHPAGFGWNWRDYPVQGGVAYGDSGNTAYTKAIGFLSVALAMAEDDPRAVELAQQVWSFYYDNQLRFAMHYHTGFTQSGAFYTFSRTSIDVPFTVLLMQRSVAGWPDLGGRSPYISMHLPFLMYGFYPISKPVGAGTQGNCYGIAPDASCPMRWGTEAFDNELSAYNPAGAGLFNLAAALNSGSDLSRYWMSWLQAVNYSAAASTDFLWSAFFAIDPNITPLDYRNLPLQQLFRQSSASLCQAVVGASCVPSQQAGGWISRSGWTNPADSLVAMFAYDFWGDHSLSQAGAYQIHKGGFLVAGDAGSPHGFGASDDATKRDSMIELGGGANMQGGYELKQYSDADIQRWAGTDPGGVASNEYVYSMVELAKTYRATIGAQRVQRHMAHLKKAGTEDIVVLYDDIQTSRGARHRGQIHYMNNGGTREGVTSCTGGCANLNTSREIHSDNTRFPMTTKILAPGGNLRVYVDSGLQCQGTQTYDNGDCSSGEGGYPGGQGFTFRVSYCGSTDGASCNDLSRETEALVVHKLGSSMNDTLLTTVPLNQDANWAGVQTADKAVLFARKGKLLENAVFDTQGADSLQYLLAGLAPGLYQVTLNGSVIAGSPFTVAPNDNSLYFYGAAGRVEVSRVQLQAALAAKPAELTYFATFKDPQPPGLTLRITSINGDELSTTVTAADPWVQVTPGSGITPFTVVVTPNASGLAEGDYGSAVNISSAGVPNSPLRVPVSLKVSGELPELRFSPHRLRFQGTTSTDPDAAVLSLTTTTGQALGVTIRTDALPPWLTVNASSLPLPGTVTVTARTKGMIPGIYLGSLLVESVMIRNSPAIVLVELTVLDSGGMELTAAAVNAARTQLGLTYGRRNLDGNTVCQIKWSREADFSILAGQLQDTGGPAYRHAVIGRDAPLSQNTPYFVRVDCGPQFTVQSARTAPNASQLALPLGFGAHHLPGFTKLLFDVSHVGLNQSSPQILPCAQGCRGLLWKSTDRLVELRRTLQDAAGTPLATGSPHYTVPR